GERPRYHKQISRGNQRGARARSSSIPRATCAGLERQRQGCVNPASNRGRRTEHEASSRARSGNFYTYAVILDSRSPFAWQDRRVGTKLESKSRTQCETV